VDVVGGERGLSLGRIGGIEVRADASWFLVVALVTWSFWDRFDAEGRFAGVAAIVMAFAGAALFFGSILAHEIAHALEARHRGVPVARITLFLFGGATETNLEARRPVDDFALTAVGPFTSLAIGAALGLVATAADAANLIEVAAVCGLVGWLNVTLAVFNLLPGAPLDGGRILRSVVWRVTGDRYRASRVAAQSGRVIGALLLAVGLLEVFFVPGAFVGGLWFAFIGWFLMGAASVELAHAELRQRLAGVTLRELVERQVDPVPADASVQDAIDGWFRVYDEDAFFVADELGRRIGVLFRDDIRGVPPEKRHGERVRDVMRVIDALPWLDADTSSAAIVDQLLADGVVVVVDGLSPLGLVTVRGLLGQLRRDEELAAVRGGRR
jgi:Zn-dependent protease